MRWDAASSRVTCAVAYSSGRTKSSRIRDEMGVRHVIGWLELALSSVRRARVAAVNAFVVEPV